MDRIRRAVSRWAVLLLPGLLLLAGCAGPLPAGADLVRVNGVVPRQGLLTTDAADPDARRILDRLFAGLMSYDAAGTPTPEVAESIDTVDNRTFRIKLEPGWTFTDGSPVTAHSFVDAWNYGALSTNGQSLHSYFAPIEGYDQVAAPEPEAQTMSGLEIVDDTEFVVRLKAPSIEFVQRLGFAPFYPLPAVAFDDLGAFGRQPIGNGPYVLAGAASGHRVDLVPNRDYRGNRTPRNPGLRFVSYPDLDAAYRDLLVGGLDVLDTVPTDAIGSADDLGGRVVTGVTAQNQTLDTPLRLPHFGGEEGRLRRLALSAAIDRTRICAQVLSGTCSPAQDFTSSVLPGFDPGLPEGYLLEFNPKLARHLWVRADEIAPWRGRYTIPYNTIAYNADDEHARWVDAVADGIRTTLDIDVVAERAGDTAFPVGRRVQYPSMLAFLQSWVTGAPGNDVGYSNRDFDGAFTVAQAAPSLTESYASTGDAQRILLRDMPVIPLWNRVATAGHSAGVTDVVIGWNGLPDYERIATVR